MRPLSTLTITLFLLLPVPASAGTILVPQDYPTIQAGIDAAVHDDTVIVADGTYSGEGNRDIRFGGKRITLRSENGPENCVIDASSELPHRVFIFDSGENSSAVLEGFTITGGDTDPDQYQWGGGIECSNFSSPIIRGNIITGNASSHGAGISCARSRATIEGNLITENRMKYSAGFRSAGGGILIFMSYGVVIRDNVISRNSADLQGESTAVYGMLSTIEMTNNLVVHNGIVPIESYEAMGFDDCQVHIRNLTLADNDVHARGGITLNDYTTAIIEDSIISNDFEPQIMVSSTSTCTVRFSNVRDGWAGEGNIHSDPLFVSGPHHDYCLSHLATGQPADSPCVDSGDPEREVFGGTTRADLAQDLGVIDMGYHLPLENPSRVVLGPGPAFGNPPTVRVFPTSWFAEFEYQFDAYGSQRHGVNVTTGEVTGDGTDKIITGAGPGQSLGPHVRGFAVDGTPLPGLSFFAYGTNNWGVNVATGDLDADGFDEIITGPGPGPPFGSHVRGWNYDGSGSITAMTDVSYFAYGTPKWGVNVSAGDIDGDGYDEIVTGAGPGSIYGPHVRGWNHDGSAIAAIPDVSFMAYGSSQFGVRVSCGDVDGDGIDEIVTAPGPARTNGMHIRGWDYDGNEVTPLPGMSFFPYEYPQVRYGATVFAGADLNSDGRDDLVVGCGPDPDAGTPVKIYRYDGNQVEYWFHLSGYRWISYGTTVAAGRF